MSNTLTLVACLALIASSITGCRGAGPAPDAAVSPEAGTIAAGDVSTSPSPSAVVDAPLETGVEPEAGCTPDPAYDPVVDAATFTSTVDNPLWPLVPGTRYVYKGGDETIEVTVASETKDILGVPNVVVRDVASVDGEVIEDTLDWYAQDAAGNVWYFGEATTEYEGGQPVSTAGSWEAGIDGARPGIVMHAVQPPPGSPYRQEYYACQAEDMAEVVSTTDSVSVPYGNFENCLKTHEFTPLEPTANEYKFYCDGVGLVLEVDANTGARVELIEVAAP
jgi:hypothetical protein